MAWVPAPVAKQTAGGTATSAVANAFAAQTQGIYNVCNPTYGATADGSTDDATSIAAALTAAGAATPAVVYAPPGTYIIGTTLSIPTGVSLIGAGNSQTIFKAKANVDSTLANPAGNGATYSMVTISAKTDVRVQGIKFDANLSNQTTGYFGTLCTLYGINISGACTNVEIVDCVLVDFFAPIYNYADGGARARCKLIGNRVTGGWYGLKAVSFDNGRIIGNEVENMVMRGIDASFSDNAYIKDNRLHTISYAGTKAVWSTNTVKAKGAIVYPTSATGKWYRCTVAGTTHATTEPVWASSITDGTVTWAEVDMTDALGIDLLSCTRCHVTENNITFPFSHAIKLYNTATDNNVHHNIIQQPGYTSASSGNDSINGNASACGIAEWVGSGACLRNKLDDNIFYQPAGYGIIKLATCVDGSINGNDFYNTLDPAIELIASHTSVIGNSFNGCDGHCINVGSDDDGGDFYPVGWLVANNRGRSCGLSLVRINGAKEGVISGNVGHSNDSGAMIRIQRHPVYTGNTPLNISVTGNISISATTYGIQCSNEDHITFGSNKIRSSGTSDTIQQTGASNVILT